MANEDGPPAGGFAPVDGEEAAPAKSTAVTKQAPFGAPAVSQQNETSAAVFGARERAAIEARTLVAQKWPRDMNVVRDQLLEACGRFRFADMAMYEKPVGDKKASGLSIRFAEEFMRTYGNIDVAVYVVSENDEQRVLEAAAVDYQRNVAYRATAVVSKYVWRRSPRSGDEVVSKKTNSQNKTTYKIRADDDAMFTSTQAASAKASREATLKHCPADLREECEEKIEETLAAIGGKDPEKFLAEILKAFFKVGVEKAQLDEYLGKSVSLLNVAEMLQLRRLCQAIKQGETDWAEVMRSAKGGEGETAPAKKPEGKGTAGFKADLKESAAQPTPAPTPTIGEETEQLKAAIARDKPEKFALWQKLMTKGDKRHEHESVMLADINADYPEFHRDHAHEYGAGA